MNRKNILAVTLIVSALMIISTISLTANEIRPSNTPESLEVVKEVFDGENWVNEIQAEIGEIVFFKITITYHNTTPGTHWAQSIVVRDKLPSCLEYNSTVEPFDPVTDGKNLTWNLGSEILYDGESFIIIFDAEVIDYGENVNFAEAEAYEYCCSRTIRGSDTATVNVIIPIPGINIEKYVWDGVCSWVEEVYADYCTNVRFKIEVENTGEAVLHNLTITDTLPDGLEFANNVIINIPPLSFEEDGKILTWKFVTLEVGETIIIEFDAHVIGMPCTVQINWVEVIGWTACAFVIDEDSAIVHINGMCMNKTVWDDDIEEWVEETTADVGEEVRFRIEVQYFGNYKLYNIKIRDTLPSCLDYTDDAIPKEPEISEDGKILWWNFTEFDDALYDGDILIIEFNAIVSENQCQECVNWANITTNECSGAILYGDDSAIVVPECAFNADAGGPYSGLVDQDVEISGSATGGALPYIFEWDLDGDGVYNDGTGQTVSYSWNSPGTYTIYLRVTDDTGDEAFDYAIVDISLGQNNPPSRPLIMGPTNNLVAGKLYTYTFSSEDPEGHDVYYFVNWGDGDIEEWIGPYASEELVQLQHAFPSKMSSYLIQIKAKDIYGEESDWGVLSISTSKTRTFSNPFFLRIIENLLEKFPLLRNILGF